MQYTKLMKNDINILLKISFLATFIIPPANEVVIPPANEVAGVYSDPYVNPSVRLFVRPSLPISNPLLL